CMLCYPFFVAYPIFRATPKSTLVAAGAVPDACGKLQCVTASFARAVRSLECDHYLRDRYAVRVCEPSRHYFCGRRRRKRRCGTLDCHDRKRDPVAAAWLVKRHAEAGREYPDLGESRERPQLAHARCVD